jgi:nucleotide-binding universal stress UspA family protein
MFSRLLFPTDCSARARSLVALIGGLEPRPEQVCAVTVVPIRGMERPLIDAHLETARTEIELLVEPLRAAGIDAPTRVLTGRPVEAILETAEEMDSHLIVLGSHGKSPMEEILKGSLSSELTRTATLPVLFVRFGILAERTTAECEQRGHSLFERLLHPSDMSDCSKRALDVVLRELPGRVGAVELVHIVDDIYQAGWVQEAEVEGAAKALEDSAAELRGAGIETGVHLIEGDPVADILRLACELDASCIVLGSRGKGLVREAVVGSVSQGILRLANKPVLVVH